MASFGKFSLTFRRYRLPIVVLNFLIFLLFLQASKRVNKDDDEELRDFMNSDGQTSEKLTRELDLLRLGYLKWRTCMDEKIDTQRLSIQDIDPGDKRFPWLEWYISESRRKAAEDARARFQEEDIGEDSFEKLWANLDGYSKMCRSNTDLWHMQPENVPGTALNYFLPIQSDKPMTFVRVGIGANVTLEKYFKSRLNANSEFFGADPNYLENAEIYEEIGTFFPFAVGDKTERKETVLKLGKTRIDSAKTVNHIGIDTFFKQLVRKNIIDYLFFEGNGGEYDMMSHLGRNGTLEQAGITVCQINIEYHRPKNTDDPRKDIFTQHILQFVKDRKYTLLRAAQLGDLRAFWVNTASAECNRRFVEKYFANEAEQP